MQKAKSGSFGWARVPLPAPLRYPDYGRLVVRCLMLSARTKLLYVTVMLLAPVATPGLAVLFGRWFDQLRDEVAEFSRTARAFREHVAAQTARHRGFQNPWV